MAGKERYHNGIIAYSLGNFLFAIGDYQKKCPEVWHSGLLKIDVSWKNNPEQPMVDWSVVPVRLDKKFLPVPVNDCHASQWTDRLNQLSEELSDKNKIQSEWKRTSLEEIRSIVFGIYYYMCNRGLKQTLKYFGHLCKEPLTWRALLGAVSKGKF
jgi:hypothetical protein